MSKILKLVSIGIKGQFLVRLFDIFLPDFLKLEGRTSLDFAYQR